MNDKKKILRVENLSKLYCMDYLKFGSKKREFAAVNNISFEVYKGETLGIVGESGCGKSTLGKMIIRLVEASSGNIYFNDENIFEAKGKRLKELREKMQIVFQDPYAALNPRMTIEEIISEPLVIAKKDKNIKEETTELMKRVGINESDRFRYPTEFSGGQRQRICIARAIALNPELLICDEPVSALDVSIQSQILNLFNRLKKENNLTYIFISHDLSVVRHISDRICVMYLGNIVEIGDAEEIYSHPVHPYTRCLLSAILKPIPHSREINNKQVIGEITGIEYEIKGCSFYPRCPYATDICKSQQPKYVDLGNGHKVKCHMIL